MLLVVFGRGIVGRKGTHGACESRDARSPFAQATRGAKQMTRGAEEQRRRRRRQQQPLPLQRLRRVARRLPPHPLPFPTLPFPTHPLRAVKGWERERACVFYNHK